MKAANPISRVELQILRKAQLQIRLTNLNLNSKCAKKLINRMSKWPCGKSILFTSRLNKPFCSWSKNSVTRPKASRTGRWASTNERRPNWTYWAKQRLLPTGSRISMGSASTTASTTAKTGYRRSSRAWSTSWVHEESSKVLIRWNLPSMPTRKMPSVSTLALRVLRKQALVDDTPIGKHSWRRASTLRCPRATVLAD